MYKGKVVILALGVLLARTATAQTTSLAVKAGQKFKVETDTKMNSSAEVMGQTMENNVDSRTTTLYTVKSAGASGIELSSVLSKAAVTAAAMGQEMSYDSDKNDNSGPMAEAFAGRLNKEKNISLDQKGYIVKQDETEEDSPLMGGGGQTNLAELFIPALNGRILKAGESFDHTDAYKTEKYNSRDSGTYKITAIDNGVASITYEGTQYVTAVMEQMGMEMTTNGTNKVKSEMQVDMKSGVVLHKKTEIESAISVEASGMTIPASGKTTTITKITPSE